ncbi:hypothetical protein RFI_23072 [Reticulomyxa filosa]|uniref:Uncharacterized protein n=1 Tax=Reticulomyxa filosa TaxID=46433 RepID=X6MKY7_RETFI|nr:hypothetical protein RFI_23072 [Reticulomyxa filosa]|eukprot:ETO14296.1 hypothetical protein RFI_23072 [Reticulomyxa filosa]
MFCCCCSFLRKPPKAFDPSNDGFSIGELELFDTVLIIPSGFTSSISGTVVAINDDETCRVRFLPKEQELNDEYKEETFEIGFVMKPQNLKTSDAKKLYRKIEKLDIQEVLLGGRDKNETEEFLSICRVLLKRYQSVLMSHEETEEYLVHQGTFTARFIAYNVTEFLSAPKYRWKVKCMFCKDSVMSFESVGQRKMACFRNPSDCRGFYYMGLSAITIYCDFCKRKIYQSEHQLRCGDMHDMCLNCFGDMIRESQNFYALLTDLMAGLLDRDCIFEITCFVKGYIVKFDISGK